MREPEIREAGAAAAELLALLHAAAFPPAERWGAQAIGLLLGLPGHFAVLAEEAGVPLGFAMGRVASEEAEVLTLAVTPARRRAGIGRALMRALMAEAAARGATALFLEVSEANAAARALYERVGAVAVGRRPRYYPDGSDALVLRAALTPRAAEPGG